MNHQRTTQIALAAVLVAGISTVGVAFAAPAGVTGTMQVDPSTVEPGGSYVISNDPGSPCNLGEVSGDTGGVRPGAWFATPDGDGNWEVTIEVPENGAPDAMGNPTPFPEGDYEQHAFCDVPTGTSTGEAAGRQGFNYDPVTVTVVAPEPEPEPEPEPPAALPVQESANFTG